MQPNYTAKQIARFWGKVQKSNNPNDCWLWIAAKLPKGYGLIGMNGRRKGERLAHRVSWIINFGDIPDELFVLHKCDNPSCVNPNHLFLGTNQDNVNDMMQKGRYKHIDARGEKNGHCKLTDVQVAEIRKRYSFRGMNGETAKELAKRFAISVTHIFRILRHRNRS